MSYLVVFVGAGLGGALRHGTNVMAARLWGTGFPFGTLAVNILGSFAMAILVELFALKAGLPQSARLFLTTGVLGGFTTFSTFSLDAMSMFERHEWAVGVAYLLLSVVGGCAAFLFGMLLMRSVLGSS